MHVFEVLFRIKVLLSCVMAPSIMERNNYGPMSSSISPQLSPISLSAVTTFLSAVTHFPVSCHPFPCQLSPFCQLPTNMLHNCFMIYSFMRVMLMSNCLYGIVDALIILIYIDVCYFSSGLWSGKSSHSKLVHSRITVLLSVLSP